MTASRPPVRRRTCRRLIAALAVPSIAALACAAPASAGLVGPGETLTVQSDAFSHPGGTVLATQSIPFTLRYVAGGGDFVEFPGVVNAYFENAVVRDDASGKLSFIYGVVYEDGMSAVGAGAGAELWAGQFASFLTDATGVVAFDAASQVARSKDGFDHRRARGRTRRHGRCARAGRQHRCHHVQRLRLGHVPRGRHAAGQRRGWRGA